MNESSLTRTEASTEMSLWSKFESPLRRSSVQTTQKTGSVRAKVIPTPELSLLSKLGRVTKLELGQETVASGNLEGCHGIEGDLHIEVLFDNPHARIETLVE